MRFQTFSEMLDYYAQHNPERCALRCVHAGSSFRDLSYIELREAVKVHADVFRAGGSRCLGLLCDGSMNCLIELFAAVQAGMQVVMLDGSAPVEILRELIQATDVDLLSGNKYVRRQLEQGLPPVSSRPQPGNILFFTSGTTSRAKAVVLSEQSLCSSAWNGNSLLPLSADDTLLCLLPLNHVFGFVCGLLWGLFNGSCVALGRGIHHSKEDFALYHPTAVSVVPVLLGHLVRHRLFNPQLKRILVGAGDCPSWLLEEVTRSGIQISFGYGLTETSSGVALSLGEDPYAMTVCPSFEVQIADDGEVLLKAPDCMMMGYYLNSDETAAALKDGWLSTGDLGRIDENGLLHITGRKKEFLELPDGNKLSLTMLERELTSVLPGRDFAVISTDASEEAAPILVIQGVPAEESSVRIAITPIIEQYPEAVHIKEIRFTAHPLPRTQTGKIRRWELAGNLLLRQNSSAQTRL